MDEMACQELVELVTDYLEGVLGPEETVRLQEHLLVCTSCDNYIAQVRATIRTAASLPPETPSTEVEQQLTDLYRQWSANRDTQ
ncbi:MAG: zf-HC2 domain-containing protein [Jatrophihabitantaceae bacterium]